MTAFESWVLTYLLNSLWQIPLVFCAAWIAARLARTAGPRMEHRIWVGALLLEVLLPFCHLRLNDLGRQVWGLALMLLRGHAADGHTQVILGAGTSSQVALPWQTAEVLAAVATAYVCSLLYFAGRLAWGVWTTEALRRRATPFEPSGETATRAARFQRLLGVGASPVHFACALAISGPATVGLRRQTLLLPPSFLCELSDADVDALLAHEFAHMARWDFAKNLLYGLLTLPAAYHPVLWLTRTRVAESRELVCDAMAAEAVGGREIFAKSLLRLARMLSDRKAPRIFHAIGIFDANIFERRVMQLTRKNHEIRSARRFAIAAACAVVAIATCTSALALRMDVKAPASDDAKPAKLKVKVGDLTIVNRVMPAYPPDAKADHVTGSVLLSATIGKDGTVQHLKLTQSVRADVDQSAMDAVRQWTYKPYLLNGDPIEVETTITVVYTLGD
jgi:TonB family protein